MNRIIASKIPNNKYPLPSHIELDGNYIDVYMTKPFCTPKYRYSIFEIWDIFAEENENGKHTICVTTPYGIRKFEGFTKTQCQRLFDEIDLLRVANVKFGDKLDVIKKLAACMVTLKILKNPKKTELPLLGALIDKIDEGLSLLSAYIEPAQESICEETKKVIE